MKAEGNRLISDLKAAPFRLDPHRSSYTYGVVDTDGADGVGGTELSGVLREKPDGVRLATAGRSEPVEMRVVDDRRPRLELNADGWVGPTQKKHF